MVIKIYKKMKKIILPLFFVFYLTGCSLPKLNPSNYLLQPSDLVVQVQTDTGSGTGTIISYADKTFVLTAGHVVDDAAHVEINLINGQVYFPDAVHFVFNKNYLQFPGHDIAILDITDSWDHLAKGLKISSLPPERRQKTHVIGYPLGLNGKDYQFTSNGEFTGHVKGFDTYNTPCTSGCSGAAMLNESEEIMGVLVMGYPSFPNLIMAVPHKVMTSFVNKLYNDSLK
jgi:V8-like Glu-specific endopeptidase